MKKYKLIFFALLILLFSLSGCSKKNNSDFQKDLLEFGDLFMEEVKIDDFSIIKRSTDDKIDTLYVEVDTSNDLVKNHTLYIMKYIYYDEGGWILEEVTPYEDSQWNSQPLKGLNISEETKIDSEVDKLLKGVINIEETNQKWLPNELTNISFDKVTALESEFNPEENKYIKSYEIEKSQGLITGKGNLTIPYIFDYYINGNKLSWRWRMDTSNISHTVTYSYDNLIGTWFSYSENLQSKFEYTNEIAGKTVIPQSDFKQKSVVTLKISEVSQQELEFTLSFGAFYYQARTIFNSEVLKFFPMELQEEKAYVEGNLISITGIWPSYSISERFQSGFSQRSNIRTYYDIDLLIDSNEDLLTVTNVEKMNRPMSVLYSGSKFKKQN